ncbi:prolipoprotein diacylglyceryl transferase [Tumebacillus flagellatus]|uniref:Phosphatidylglycerol--prolipoprotein diacylglyceryl transferase n=1 Tax=Tumebacillus flagellatus TaxID=1157490 RepID=A0A074LNS4_9BACL|nr:prolipoprotein diacylglyceryl transferase [Tumebacillus flagellatus]KEO83816.1 diacylglyceryl transferase [Tumebacillus flagellatus]
MHVILFHIGSFEVRSYGTIVAIAILLACGLTMYMAKQERKYEEHVLGLVIWAIVGAIIGARFWQVFFFEWHYYSTHLSEMFAIWNGGMSIQGGLVGGFIGGGLYTYFNKILFWEFADIAAPGIILGQAVGRIACLLNGDAFGSPTGSNFGLVYPPGTFAYDTYGDQPLWPAEVWEGQWDLIVLALLFLIKMRKVPTGYLFLFYNILYSFGRLMLEFLRGDTDRFAGLTAAQWTSLIVIVLALGCMVYLRLRPAKNSQPRGDKQEEPTPA